MNQTMPKSKISPEMDPKIWANLPIELLDRILCFLPLKTFFKLRSTCKHFQSLLSNPSFLSNFSSSSSNLCSFLLLSHPIYNRYFPLYDSVSGKWRSGSSVSRSLLNPCTSSSSLLSSSNGLLCFHLPSSGSFLVTNLLSRSSTLVKFPKLPFSFDLLTLISSPNGGFKIFVSSSKNVFLYDSKAQSWARFSGFEPVLNDSYHQEGVHINGYLYFTTSDPISVVCFDLKTGNWSKPFNEFPTNELAFIRLVSGSNGEIYLIGGVGGNGISRSMKLWELKSGELSERENWVEIQTMPELSERENWVEIQTMPELMYKKFVSVCFHNYEHIYCFWHQGLICICCYTWPEVLYYKVSRKTWHWLPKCPSLSDKWSCGFRWFSFVPMLCASV